jgi:hypothetical protein
MKRFVLTLALILFAGLGTSAFAQEPQSAEKEQNIRRLLQLTKAGEAGVQMIEALLPQARGLFASLPPALGERVYKELEAEMRREFTSEKMIEAAIPIYARHLTNDDVLQLIAFYESPVGQKAIEVLPQILKEAVEDGQRRGMEAGQRVVQKLLSEGAFDQKPPGASAPPPRPKPATPRRRRR